jgi:hypothetical protein
MISVIANSILGRVDEGSDLLFVFALLLAFGNDLLQQVGIVAAASFHHTLRLGCALEGSLSVKAVKRTTRL